MKLIVFTVIVGLMFTHPSSGTEKEYVDISAVVADLASLQAYSNCLLDKGPCTSFTQSLKDITQDSVNTACANCNVQQKQGFGKFLKGLKANLPQDYQSYRQKYDPNNLYFDALEAELNKF